MKKKHTNIHSRKFFQSNFPYRKPIALQVCCKLVSFLSQSSITITTKSPHRNCAISEMLRKSIRLKGLISCVEYFLRRRLSKGIMNRRLLSIHKRPSSANTPLVHLSHHSFNCGETLNLKRN